MRIAMDKASYIFPSTQCWSDWFHRRKRSAGRQDEDKSAESTHYTSPRKDAKTQICKNIITWHVILESLPQIGEHAERNSKYPLSSRFHDDHLSSGHYLNQQSQLRKPKDCRLQLHDNITEKAIPSPIPSPVISPDHSPHSPSSSQASPRTSEDISLPNQHLGNRIKLLE